MDNDMKGAWAIGIKSNDSRRIPGYEVTAVINPDQYICISKWHQIVFSTMCYPRSDLVRTPVFLCCTIKETDSKVEQGNDNLIACDSNGSSTATENYSTMSVTIICRDATAIAAAAAAAVQ